MMFVVSCIHSLKTQLETKRFGNKRKKLTTTRSLPLCCSLVFVKKIEKKRKKVVKINGNKYILYLLHPLTPTPPPPPSRHIFLYRTSIESRVRSLESRVQSPESGVRSPESRVQSPESRVQSPESRVQSPESSPAFTLYRVSWQILNKAFPTVHRSPLRNLVNDEINSLNVTVMTATTHVSNSLGANSFSGKTKG